MSIAARVQVPWPLLAAGAVALVAAGSGVTYLGLRAGVPAASGPGAAATAAPAARATEGTAPASPVSSAPEVVVTLNADAVARAGIVSEPVASEITAEAIHSPGVVEANAYRQVVVTPLVGGRVTSVNVELGQRVARGQPLAQIVSPDLADAQTRYIAARAALGAHELELARTEKLVGIGAASQQELERAHADHTARRAEIESAASRLRLLGLSADAIAALRPETNQGATIVVPAPIAGIVTERPAAVGLNVDAATPLVTVVDVSSVWVVANLYEREVQRVGVGTPATVTIPAVPQLVLQGRVSYIDPQVSPETRTTRVRVEVPNARAQLRLGMYADVVLGGGQAPALSVPRSAVQTIGNLTVVYVVDPHTPGTFTERQVQLGTVTGTRVAIVEGVQAGDHVVVAGSFAVRAERERLGLSQGPPIRHTETSVTRPAPTAAGAGRVHEVRVTVTDSAFEPSRLNLNAGVPARITFTRTSNTSCATAVVFPSLGIRRDLPLNTPVAIDVPPQQAGEIAFACGLNMLKGTIVVQ